MRNMIALALALSFSAPTLGAAPGTADNFLERAERLEAKGPLAFFDGDYSRLKAEATVVGKAIGDDRIAAQKTGRPILYCSPSPRAQLGSFEFIRGLEAIAPNERARMTLKEAMIRVLQKKYPCRA